MHHPKEAIIDGVKFVLIPEELLEKVKKEIRNYWFSFDEEGESYNNDEVIELSKELEKW